MPGGPAWPRPAATSRASLSIGAITVVFDNDRFGAPT